MFHSVIATCTGSCLSVLNIFTFLLSLLCIRKSYTSLLGDPMVSNIFWHAIKRILYLTFTIIRK